VADADKDRKTIFCGIFGGVRGNDTSGRLLFKVQIYVTQYFPSGSEAAEYAKTQLFQVIRSQYLAHVRQGQKMDQKSHKMDRNLIDNLFTEVRDLYQPIDSNCSSTATIAIISERDICLVIFTWIIKYELRLLEEEKFT